MSFQNTVFRASYISPNYLLWLKVSKFCLSSPNTYWNSYVLQYENPDKAANTLTITTASKCKLVVKTNLFTILIKWPI